MLKSAPRFAYGWPARVWPLLLLAWASPAWAQIGAGAGAATDAAGSLASTSAALPPPTMAAPPAAGGSRMVHFFSAFNGACDRGKMRCCQTPFGQLLSNAMRPVSAMTGGIVPVCCSQSPATAAAALATANGQPPPPSVAAAAKIQAEEAQAKVRREAVRYLGTVDCHYWPEAEAALITSLRCDRNECVRYEAALSLSKGCCCTKAVIEALSITVSSSERDGNPSETSMRVKCQAYQALQLCLMRCSGTEMGLPAGDWERPEMPTPVGGGPALSHQAAIGMPGQIGGQPASHTTGPSSGASTAAVLASARHVLATAAPVQMAAATPRRGHSLYELWQAADAREPTPALPLAPTPAAVHTLPVEPVQRQRPDDAHHAAVGVPPIGAAGPIERLPPSSPYYVPHAPAAEISRLPMPEVPWR